MAKNNTGEDNTGKFGKGHTPWNKGLKGLAVHSDEYKQKVSKRFKGRKLSDTHIERIKNSVKKGENHPSWKGDKVGLSSLHEWVRKTLGTPSLCVVCGTSTAKRFEWANISRMYKRVVEDWARLCTSCHHKYDKYNDAEVEKRLKGLKPI